jgi:polar amino acid transport system permease protein
MNQTTMRTIPIFTLVLLMYLVMSLCITIAMKRLEKTAAKGMPRGRSV